MIEYSDRDSGCVFYLLELSVLVCPGGIQLRCRVPWGICGVQDDVVLRGQDS